MRSVVWPIIARKLIMLAIRVMRRSERYHCISVANRYAITGMISPVLEAVIVLRNTRKPDGWSREELVLMLRTIREQERITGWKVPEA